MKRPKRPPARPLPPDVGNRLPALLGVFAAALLVALWCYPSGAHPMENLLFCVTLAGLGIILTLELFRSGDKSVLVSLHAPLVWVATLFVLYAALRWRFSPVPALGREWVANLLWLPAALLAGLALAANPAGDARAFFRRALVSAAIGFGLYAIYQRTVAYPAAAAELQAGLEGPIRDLMTQSLLHALREGRVAGRLGNPNLFAAQLSVLAVFCVATSLADARRLWRWIGFAALIAALVAVGLSRSRGGVLTFGFAAVAAGLLNRRRGLLNKRAIAAACAPLILFCASNAAAAGWLERLGRIDTIRERLFYWEIAWKVWRRNPVFGEGPGGFELYYPLLKSPLARESQYAHSWLFQSAADLGLVGLLLMCLLWLLVARRLHATLREPGAIERIWPLCAAVVLAFNGLFEFSLQWREFIIPLGFFMGLGLGPTLPNARIPQPLLPKPAYLSLSGIILTLALGFFVSYRTARAGEANWRGDLSMQAGDYPDAVVAYLDAARFAPDDPEYHVALSGALVMSGDKLQAWTMLDRAQTLNPRSASVRAAKAAWLQRERRFDEALAALDQAVQLYPTRVAYRLDRARLHLAQGNREAARADLNFIQNENLPVWEIEREPYNSLRLQTGLSPLNF